MSREDLIKLFTDRLASARDLKLTYKERDRLNHLIKILGEHKFWNSQAISTPVAKVTKIGEIQKFKAEEIPDEPIKLPPGFEWSDLDVEQDEQVKDLCDFLETHYVEDDVGCFRLKYSPEKTRWAITMPGYHKEMHFLVRETKKNKIMASIMGVPKKLSILGQVMKVCEVNFLAVHKKLRSKRLA